MTSLSIKYLTVFFAASLLLLPACGGEQTTRQNNTETASAAPKDGLSDFELEHGIGPVTQSLEVGDIDPELVTKGKSIFQMKCEMCHNMEGRMVGPPLGEVADRRSPEYIMNFILNPGGMVREHPVGKELLQEYMTIMPFQNVKDEEARAIVEYLRDYYNQNH